MNCERIREQIPEALAGPLDQAAREALVEHLEGCAGFRAEVAQLNAVWRGLETVQAGMDTAPDPGAKVRFQEMLAAYQAGMASVEIGQSRRTVPRVRRFAMAGGLLLGGLVCGRFLPRTGAGGDPQMAQEMAQLRSQVEDLHQKVALSMLQQQSPSARLRGVTYSEKIATPDPRVLDALPAPGGESRQQRERAALRRGRATEVRRRPGSGTGDGGCHPRGRNRRWCRSL